MSLGQVYRKARWPPADRKVPIVSPLIHMILHVGVSKNRGTPKWMVKIMENPIKIDDLGVSLFLETPMFQIRFSAELRNKLFVHKFCPCFFIFSAREAAQVLIVNIISTLF